jgi:hypothetical protein
MNEYEVEDVQGQFDPTEFPNLATAARILGALVDWTNSNSDGWPFWRKPAQAAKSLMGTLADAQAMDRNGTLFDDIPDRDLTRVLVPIKSFLRRQEVKYHADLPWAAILPHA